MRLIRLVARFLRPYAWLIVAVVMLQLVQTIANLLLPSLNADIIDEGINGCLIEPFDLDAMAAKIAALMDNPTLRKNYSENSKIGMEKFSKPTILQSWENLLKEV